MIFALYRMMGVIVGPLISIYMRYRLAKGKEDKYRFKERFGITNKIRPEGMLIWFHGASVGEALSLLPIINRLRQEHSEFHLLLTTGTMSSAKLMEKYLPKGAFHQYVPIDRTNYVRRFLGHWSPNLVMWAESEFWPNLLIETAKNDIPLVLVQGRVSPKTFKSWLKARGLIAKVLSGFKICFAQTNSDAERLKILGAPIAKFVGNIKSEAPKLEFNTEDFQKVKLEIGPRPVWLAASTHPGEEAIVWDVHLEVSKKIPDLLTIIVPRHIDRGQTISEGLVLAGAEVAIRSSSQSIDKGTQVYVADTMGELGLFYRLVEIVFIGKSLVDLGGQNLVEPAKLNNTILHGPYMWNFSEIMERMGANNATIQVSDGKELAWQLTRLLGDKKIRLDYANSALKFANHETGVIDNIFLELSPILTKVKEKYNE